MHKLVIGRDFGSDSIRAVLLQAQNGDDFSATIADCPRSRRPYCEAAAARLRTRRVPAAAPFTALFRGNIRRSVRSPRPHRRTTELNR